MLQTRVRGELIEAFAIMLIEGGEAAEPTWSRQIEAASLPYNRGSLGSNTTSFLMRLLFGENGTSLVSGPISVASWSVQRPAL